MDPSSLSPVQLWCPRPFGTYSQNQPRSAAPSARKPPPPTACPEPGSGNSISSGDGLARSENTPPAPPTPAAPLLSTAPGEEGRVLLDTWYVIKPGNTKEKVAFFVAHQCGGGASRASAGKVKGHWGSDSSKAKRRRRCLDSTKPRPGPGKPLDGGGEEDQQLPASSEASACAPEDVDLLSVAEMVALVEQRAALALQSYPRAGAPTPVVFVSAAEQGAQGAGEERRPGSDCSRVAEAVAHFEARRDGPRKEEVRTGDSVRGGGPGEVRIAFRISSGREPRSPEGGPPGSGSGGRPGCPYGSGQGPSSRAQDKITCDLYQLISPSRDALPSNVDFLLARADEAGDGEAAGASRPEGPPERATAGATAGDKPPAPPPPPAGARECGGGGAAGFHVDVVVTGVVDQCVFFGKDGAKTVKEETVCLTVSPEEPPPPGQLFLLPARGEPAPEAPAAPEAPTAPAPEGSEPEVGGGAGAAAAPDASLCRLYHHVSHDFLEIRFKIQRLLEPRQYMLLLPEHVLVKIFGFLPTRALAALKCTCHYFKCVIETFGVQATDSRWSRHPLYRDDPCKQCRKCYEKGDVSLCRWHPKPYHHDLPYGRSYWMCCRRPDKDTPGCRLGLHDNNWVLPCHALRPAREDAR